VKNTAGWWATDAISETEFVNAIEFLVNDNIIQVASTTSAANSESVPDWVKNTAGWWATDAISETEFVNAIEFLIKDGIIIVNKDCKFSYEDYIHLEKTTQELLCKHSDFNFVETWYDPVKFDNNETNSHGFRNIEFLKEKYSDTYRIFVVGGSTIFGAGVDINNTIPAHLQKNFDDQNFNNLKEIEVINAGQNGAISYHETELIKNKLQYMMPDLIIVYDGWNDSKIGNYGTQKYGETLTDISWKNKWLETCKNYKDKFEIVIVLQPILEKNEKELLTDQEYTNFYSRKTIIQEAENLDKLRKHVDILNINCSSAHDLKHIMNNESSGIFYDQGHMTPLGNKIIADKLYEISIPIIEKNFQINGNFNIEKTPIMTTSGNEYNSNLDYRGKIIEDKNLSEKEIQNLTIYYSKFSETDFSSSDLKYMDSKFSKFFSSNFSNAQLENSSISRTDFINSNFSNADLSESYLGTSSFSNSNLSSTKFINSNLKGIIMKDVLLDNTNFENVNFSHSRMQNIDFTKASLKNSIFTGTSFHTCNFDGVDFSTIIIHGESISPTSFHNCNMKNSIFSNIDMNSVDFTSQNIFKNGNYVYTLPGSDLSHSLFTDIDLRNTIFSLWAKVDHKSFFNEQFDIPNDIDILSLVKNDISVTLNNAKFINVNLSGNDMSLVNLRNTEIINSDLTNTSFKNSDLSFSIIKNSKLSNADLEGANLSGVIIDDMTVIPTGKLNCVGHEICS